MREKVLWSCNCVLCRTFVHPVIRRFGRKIVSELERPSEEETKESVSQSFQQPVIDVNEIKEAVAEHISLIVDSKLREFSSRVDNVENEIKKVREDFSKSIDEIKSVLVDMRATVADVLNPFNILKIYGGGSKKGVPRTSQIIESFEKALESLGRKEISQQVGESKREDKEVSRESLESISREIIYRSSSRLGLYGLIKLVKWVDEMIDRVPRDVIEEIAKFMRKTELIDEEEEKIISGVLDFVYKARKLGLRVNDQIIYMYNLAKVFGIDDKKAGEEVLKLAMDNNSLG